MFRHIRISTLIVELLYNIREGNDEQKQKMGRDPSEYWNDDRFFHHSHENYWLLAMSFNEHDAHTTAFL